MKFSFSEEQEEFRSFLRRFLEEKSPTTEVRRLMATDAGWEKEQWRKVNTELGLTAIAMASLYNSQSPVTYNEYGIPRKDLSAYRQIFGTIIGLIFSSEVFDAISTLLTPTDTIILSEAEYEKENY